MSTQFSQFNGPVTATTGDIVVGLRSGLNYQFTAASFIQNIAGTLNQIDVTSSPNAIISIDAAYAGQSSITTLGTIATGTWAGTTIAVAHGGTGTTTLAANAVLLGNGTGAITTVSGLGTATYVLTSNGAGMAPTWQAATGAIISVTGTANQIDVTAGANPVISIDAAYVGQASITTLGTISAGVWGGSTISVGHGGTSNTTFTAYSVLCAGVTSTGAFQNVSGLGTSGYVLTSQGAGALPQWVAPVGTGTVNSATQYYLAYYATTGTAVSGLATGNNGTLITSAGGVPSISSTLPAAVQGNITATGALASGSLASGFTVVTVPLGGTGAATFTQYGVMLGNGTGALTEVSGLGTATYVLTSNGAGSAPTWQAAGGGGGGITTIAGDTGSATGSTVTLTGGSTGLVFTGATATVTMSGTLALANGGTNNALTASNGGIVYSDASKLDILAGTATAGQLLQSGSSAAPTWTTSTYPATNAASTLLYASSANVMAALATANSGVLITSAGGVPSISTTIPATTQGNITATGALASGSLAAGFTAVTVPLGGTGNTTFTAYSVICAGTTATGTMQNVSGLGSSGNVLTSNGAGALPTWQAASGGGGGNTTTSVTQAAHGFSVGNIVQSSGTADTYQLAKADTAANADIAGIIAAVTTNTFSLLTSGVITTLSGLTTGVSYYLSATSAGNYTATPPVTAGSVNKPLFYAIDTTSAVWYPYRGDVVPSTSASTAIGNNLVLNGEFSVWQRGAPDIIGGASITQAASVTAYTVDMFQLLTNANQAFTVYQKNGAGPGDFRCQVQRNSGQTGTGVVQFGYTSDYASAAGIAGQPLTIQFLASTGANWSPTSGNLTVTVSYGTGTTDGQQCSNISSAFTGNTSILSQTIALGTSAVETLYSFTTAACSSTATQFSVVFSFTPVGTASTNDWFKLGNLQIETGSTANLFQHRKLPAVLQDCQYWYYKNCEYGVAPAQAAGVQPAAYFQSCPANNTAGGASGVSFVWCRSMTSEIARTVVLYDPAAADAQIYNTSTSVSCTNTAVSAKNSEGMKVTFTTDGGSNPGSLYTLMYSVSSNLT